MSISWSYYLTFKGAAGIRPVYLPGTQIQLGDIVTTQGRTGVLSDVANIKQYGVDWVSERPAISNKLEIQSSGVRTKLMQGGVSVDAVDIGGGAVDVTTSFSRSNSWSLKTTKTARHDIANVAALGPEIVKKIPDWRFGEKLRWYLVTGVLMAEDYSFLASSEANRSVTFSGSANATIDFINAGIKGSMKKTSSASVSVERFGSELGNGPWTIAVEIAKIGRNGVVVIA